MIIETNENFEQLRSVGIPSAKDQEIEYKPFFSVQGIEWRLNDLLGHVLTTIDAAITDPVQRKAVKDIIKNQTWRLMSLIRDEVYNPYDGAVAGKAQFENSSGSKEEKA